MSLSKFFKNLLDMSTHCNVGIFLKPEDINKELYANDGNNNHFIKTSNNMLEIYIHHDGYVEGVGAYLKKNLTKYEDVLNYILQGDRTSATVPYTERGETWVDNKPFSINVENLDKFFMDIPEEYYYIYNNGVWYYKYYSDKELKKL